MRAVKKVYVYNRINGKITEHDVKKVDACFFACYDYSLNGEETHEYSFDLRNAAVMHLSRSFHPDTREVLVSLDKGALGWIKESDHRVFWNIRNKIHNIISEEFDKLMPQCER